MSLSSLRKDLEIIDGIIDKSVELDKYLYDEDYEKFIDSLNEIKSNIAYKLNEEELKALHNINKI